MAEFEKKPLNGWVDTGNPIMPKPAPELDIKLVSGGVEINGSFVANEHVPMLIDFLENLGDR